MNVTSNTMWDCTDSGYFNGIPCRVYEGYDIILEQQGKTTREYTTSVEFLILEKAGAEVHSGGFS